MELSELTEKVQTAFEITDLGKLSASIITFRYMVVGYLVMWSAKNAAV